VRELHPGGARKGSDRPMVPLGCRAYYVYAKKNEDRRAFSKGICLVALYSKYTPGY